MQLLLVLFFSTFITLAVTHIFATEFFLYWKYLWLDIPMHFLGGVVIALGAAILPFVHVRFFDSFRSFWVVMFAILCVSIAWEIFEAVAGVSVKEPGVVFDTVLDLVMAFIGGIVGHSAATYIKKI